MSVQIRRRREAASFLSTFVGAQGELIVDTTNNRVQVHDGTTAGGFAAARLDEVAPATKFTAVADANYTMLPTDGVVALTAALTAPRTLTLPAAASVKPGKSLRITDQAGGVSAINTLSLAATGADRVNSAASAAFVAPYADFNVVSDGVSKWTYDVQGIARGGTGATTAAGALAALGLNTRTVVADASYPALPADRTIAFTALTAARTVTLPAASAYPTGTQLLVVDEAGQCGATRPLTIARAGADTINGGASAIVALPYGFVALECDGVSKWTIIDQSTGTLAQQAANAVAITGGTIDGTAIGATASAAGTFTQLGFGTALGAAGTPNRIGLTGDVTVSGWGLGRSSLSLDYCVPGASSFHSYYFAGTLRHRVAGTLGATYLYSLDNTPIGATTAAAVRGTTIAATTSFNLPGYTIATLPAAGTAGRLVFCSNARMQTATAGTLESASAGTGGLVSDNGAAWKIAGTNITASA